MLKKIVLVDNNSGNSQGEPYSSNFTLTKKSQNSVDLTILFAKTSSDVGDESFDLDLSEVVVENSEYILNWETHSQATGTGIKSLRILVEYQGWQAASN